MRLVSACLVGSLPVPFLVPLCVASFLRFAHRAVWRAARPRLPLRLPAPCLLLVSHRFPIVMALASYRLPPRSSLLPAHRPADRVEGRGDEYGGCLCDAWSFRCLPRGVGVGACPFSFACRPRVSACLPCGAVAFSSFCGCGQAGVATFLFDTPFLPVLFVSSVGADGVGLSGCRLLALPVARLC